jgi:hypothetical protein
MLCASLALTGCGDDYGYYDDYYYPPPYPPPTLVTEILSDPALDGDISKDFNTGAFSIIQGMTPSVQSVFAGTDPATGDESRAFLNFPLTGVNGVPGNAIIYSATLNIFINAIQTPSGSFPVRIDLVSTQPTLVGTDFNSTALASVSTTFFQSDSGQYVNIDVTPLMTQAQYLQLANFQVRVLVALPPGVMEINDITGANRSYYAPLLTVSHS